MNQSNNETKLCKKCGKQVPLNQINVRVNKGVRRQSNICKDCYNAHRRQKRREANIRKFMVDDSMKLQIHYKEIHPAHILAMEQSGIELIAEEEVFVKLLDYKDSWISNYGRAVSYYNGRYSFTRKKVNKDGEICYQLSRNVFDGRNWVWKKQVIEAWKLVVKEFIVNHDIANNICCWHKGNNKEDTYYRHLYPLNQYQYDAVRRHYEETRDDSEAYILDIMNSVNYRPDGWEPSHMRKSMFGIGYLGCGDVDVRGEIYRKWANMM